MLVLLALLLISSYVTAILARATLIVWQVRRAGEGKKLWPLSFAARTIQSPRGDAPILALGADLWAPPGAAPATSLPAIPAVPASTSKDFALFPYGIAIGRSAWRLDGARGIARRIEGRTRRDRGFLIVTDRRVGWRGTGEQLDILLTDVAHLEVRRPLIEIRRHSRPGDPLVVRVPQPVAVAQLIALLSARAMGYTVRATPAPAGTPVGAP